MRHLMIWRGLRTWVCILNSCYVLLFFSSCHFIVHSFHCFPCCLCYPVTDTPKEPKAIVVSAKPTAPILAGPCNSLALVPFLIIILLSLLCLLLFFFFPYWKLIQCLKFLLSPSLTEEAPSTRFEIGSSFTTVLDPWVRLLLSLLISSRWRQMTLIQQTSRVLDLPIRTSMDTRYLRNMLCIWRQFTAIMGTSCKGSPIAILWRDTFLSCWGAWWMI